MRFRTLEIRWHDNKPISTCDFQPMSFKRARPPVGQEDKFTGHIYRLATGGEDNHVRVWMVYPNIRPTCLVKDDANAAAPRPPRIEYLSTLSRHSAAVNVVRFSPNGELIASAGDDGMIIIWAQSTNPHSGAYGSDLPSEELQLDKEFWKPRITFRCTTMQVYDLAWSPTGEYIIAGSTDNTARVFVAIDGKCVCEIAEHSHFVQGVAWDPLNEYIATQSSDRSMHVYRISTKNGIFEAHAVGRNTRMPYRHSRTPSAHGSHTNNNSGSHSNPSRPQIFRSASTASDAESAVSENPHNISPTKDLSSAHGKDEAMPLTPATSVASTPSLSMFPPPPISIQPPPPNPQTTPTLTSVGGNNPSSRRSSFSASSNAPGSPLTHSTTFRYNRSPSPMPPLPAIAIRTSPAATAAWANVKLYGDESYTNFFRRLTFSPDGGLLVTPAGQFEDPSINIDAAGNGNVGKEDNGTPSRGRRGRANVAVEGSNTDSNGAAGKGNSTSSVYIYSRANFARPPIAQLPGHKKASVAVRFSPILYELRPSVAGPAVVGEMDLQKDSASTAEKITEAKAISSAVLEKGVEGSIDINILGPTIVPGGNPEQGQPGQGGLMSPQRTPIPSQPQSQSESQGPIISPSPRLPLIMTSQSDHGSAIVPSPSPVPLSASVPMTSPVDIRPPTPAASKPSTPSLHSQGQGHSVPQTQAAHSTAVVNTTASMFALPYRMLYAVVTMDAVVVYDTQQAGPICLLTKLHYDEFTDMTWSPDGQALLLSSRDGYCTIVIFDEILPAHHTQQHALQLQSIAHHNSVPLVTKHSNNASTSISQSTQSTPNVGTVGLPHAQHSVPPISLTPTAIRRKRSEPPLTPASVDSDNNGGTSSTTATGSYFATESGNEEKDKQPVVNPNESNNENGQQPPPKKKRRVALTRVGDLD